MKWISYFLESLFMSSKILLSAPSLGGKYSAITAILLFMIISTFSTIYIIETRINNSFYSEQPTLPCFLRASVAFARAESCKAITGIRTTSRAHAPSGTKKLRRAQPLRLLLANASQAAIRSRLLFEFQQPLFVLKDGSSDKIEQGYFLSDGLCHLKFVNRNNLC